MDQLTKGFVPQKTLEEKFHQIQREKKYLKKNVVNLVAREVKVRKELGYPGLSYITREDLGDYLNS